MEMNLSRCQLTKKVQFELMRMFVAEVTARTAADLVGINRNSARLFYHKLREIIAHNLYEIGEEYFDGEIELDESYFGGVRTGKEVVARQEKFLFSVF
jgi:transposase